MQEQVHVEWGSSKHTFAGDTECQSALQALGLPTSSYQLVSEGKSIPLDDILNDHTGPISVQQVRTVFIRSFVSARKITAVRENIGVDFVGQLNDVAAGIVQYGQFHPKKVLLFEKCPIDDQICNALPDGAVLELRLLYTWEDLFLTWYSVLAAVFFLVLLVIGIILFSLGLDLWLLKDTYHKQNCFCNGVCNQTIVNNECDGEPQKCVLSFVSHGNTSNIPCLTVSSQGCSEPMNLSGTFPCLVPRPPLDTQPNYCPGEPSGTVLVLNNYDPFEHRFFVFGVFALLFPLFVLLTCCIGSCCDCFRCCKKCEKGIPFSKTMILLAWCCFHLANITDSYLNSAIGLFIVLKYEQFRTTIPVLTIFVLMVLISDYPSQQAQRLPHHLYQWGIWTILAFMLESLQFCMGVVAVLCESGAVDSICVKGTVPSSSKQILLCVLGIALAESFFKTIVHTSSIFAWGMRVGREECTHTSDEFKTDSCYWAFAFPELCHK